MGKSEIRIRMSRMIEFCLVLVNLAILCIVLLFSSSALEMNERTNLHRWNPKDQIGGRKGLPTRSVYNLMTSNGLSPTNIEKSNIPPILLQVTVGGDLVRSISIEIQI